MKLTSKLFVFALFFVSLTASAQRKQSVLWQVSGKGLQHPSYLLGTVHTLPAVLDKFPVKQYMRQAQFGVFENKGNPINLATASKPSALERPQPPLDSLFSKREYMLVDSFFTASPLGSIKDHNTDADLVGMVQAVMMLKNNSSTEPISLDTSIALAMRELGKPLFSLDAEDDPDITTFYARHTQLAGLLVALIKDKTKAGPLSASDKAYLGQLSANLLLDKAAPSTIKDMTVRRNLWWIPQLEQKMQEGSCFVAVGLGHLQYKEGLINLLRGKGYTLKPIALAKNK